VPSIVRHGYYFVRRLEAVVPNPENICATSQKPL
jgi:hypothetical protein